VFFVPGYDPNAPRRYRELYRAEAARQAEISGFNIDVARVPGTQGAAWTVTALMDGQLTHTTVELLTWEDIVRKSMSRSILATYWVMLRTIWVYLASGAFVRLVRLRALPMLVAIYPVFALLLQLGLALGAGYLGVLATRFIGAPAWIVGAGITYAGLEAFRRADSRYFAYYLIHDYWFAASGHGKTPAPLVERLEQFARRLSAVTTDDADEILIVGHSTGAQLASTRPEFGLLTLGQVIPMQSFLPRADALRADLAHLSRSEALTWVDVSAPGDGACFALSDPVAVSGMADEGQRWPLVLSAAFTQSLSPAQYRATKWRFFRRHIQYLCAFDEPERYDYFSVTAGPQTLGARFAGRVSSPSMITRNLRGGRR